ncbi:MAG: DUF2334 domain-containing protein [Sphingobium sp.]
MQADANSALPSSSRTAAGAAADAPNRKLVVSIHDVAPPFEGEVDRLIALASPVVGSGRLAMLVVPDHWRGGCVVHRDSAFAQRVRRWADEGIEIILHGWSHRDETRHEKWRDSFRARRMTAGEGEFLGLSYHEARDRLQRGRALLEDITGRPVAGFVAPAWLYGQGARDALADCGFTMAEDHLRIWNPASGQRMAGGPVISWASRSRARIASSLVFAGAAPMLLSRQPLVRIALHPGDVHVPALVRSIGRTLRHFAAGREAVRYAEL